MPVPRRLSPLRHPKVLAATDLKHPHTADLDRAFQHAVSHDEQMSDSARPC